MTKAKRKATSDELDEALRETFPASDPVSIQQDDKGAGVRMDRQPASIDHDLVERLSREVQKKRAKIIHH